MRRIKMIGLCVVAACALAVIGGTATASAASKAKFGVCVAAKKAVYADSNCKEPAMKKGVPAPTKGKFEFEGAGECYPTKHGNYADNVCSKLAEKKGAPAPGKGKFEKAPLPTATVTSGPAELVTKKGAVKCLSSSGTQSILSPTTQTATTTFEGCTLLGQKCHNETNPEGVIKTFLLNGVLVEPAAGKASINLTGTGKDGHPGVGAEGAGKHEGQYLAEFTCTGVADIRAYGKLGGALTPVNTMGTTVTTTFEKGVEQELVSDFAAVGTEFSPFEAEPSEQLGSVLATSATTSEVHAG